MKTYFTFQDLWDTIEEGFSTPEDTSSLTAAKKKGKALFILQQAVTDTIFPRIMGATTAKEAWTTLQEAWTTLQEDSKEVKRYVP
uniref:DUF4219 domain-containing protein n=1 Tax=Cajanus cajan TaxID=3821 RepID=A0A151TFU5_CAJCA|nr:hypothetical protein KK1_012193 [Cajanus cajan]